MLKALAHPLICFLLIFSILAPSIVPLIDKDCPIAVFLDSSEEEKSKDKESEKKLGEKDLFLNSESLTNNFLGLNIKAEDTENLCMHSDVMTEILLPPPEKLV
ncbi:hypothetical protein [Flagellimonas myxillae]|uniref:hypothetical protein n=1 Tax=Flagellimonas myxillae TaxID=2942214 RepID=UPI00201F0E70|nr:hypothetical protein [Muricauda myxillae]MCL6267371.1 hypothetical protein [Muricauda myxillae]